MGCTSDLGASDGLNLDYFKDNKHRPALPRVPGEFSVWFSGAYVVDNVKEAALSIAWPQGKMVTTPTFMNLNLDMSFRNLIFNKLPMI